MSSSGGGRARSASESTSESRSTRSNSRRGRSGSARSAHIIDEDKRCFENFPDDRRCWCGPCVHTAEINGPSRAKKKDCQNPLRSPEHALHHAQKEIKAALATKRRTASFSSTADDNVSIGSGSRRGGKSP